MYAVIYWIGDDMVFPHLTRDKQIKLFDKIGEADDCADTLEEAQNDVVKAKNLTGKKLEARVISIETAKE